VKRFELGIRLTYHFTVVANSCDEYYNTLFLVYICCIQVSF